MPFDLADLDLFGRIAEAGSITHGARRAHLALPSASARVANMERALGTALLEVRVNGISSAGHSQAKATGPGGGIGHSQLRCSHRPPPPPPP